jgi:hypothetical protein
MLSKLFTPDTVDYMIAGYVVITVGIGIYLTSMITRWKKAAKAYRRYSEERD